MKKQNNILKNIPVYVTIAGFVIATLTGYITLQLQAKETEEKTNKNEEEIEEVKDENEELDKKVEVAKKEQENIAKEIQQINIKQDKIYDLLLDIKNKKK